MCLSKIADRLEPFKYFADTVLSPLALLLVRLVVAYNFFISGWLKFGYVLNDQLDTLYFLFDDYNVPFLPVKVAAWMGMSGELGLSTLLALGLFGRFSALGLIFMSGVIYHADHNPLAQYWALLCLIIAIHGAGKLSVDTFVFKSKLNRRTSR